MKNLLAALTAALVSVPALAAGATEVHIAAPQQVDRPFQLYFPQDVTVTDFSDSFGYRRPSGSRHQGNDLVAPKLTPVYAGADGVVIRINESPRAGRHVMIAHAGGYETWYLHLNNDDPGHDNGRADWSLTVAEGIEKGAFVTAGQLIGFVGDSGNAEGKQPHTHFEVHHDGRAIDPYPFLVAAADRAWLVETLRRIEILLDAGAA